MNKPIVAFLYDFDKTLCTRDMQEYTFIPSIGMEPNDFWHLANGLAEQEHMDSVLAYMYCMLTRTTLRRDHLVECGHDVVYNPGVEDWFDRINAYGDALGVKVEHYVLSSGLKEIIEGTSIADRFTKIFASEFLYDDKGVALWPKLAVNYTSKTQFVYRINKGVLDISNDRDLNRSAPDTGRRVKFSNMIYIGDGLTDVPCMKLVRAQGGHSIAVHQGVASMASDLIKHARVDFIFEADYRKDGPLDTAIHTLLAKLALDNRVSELTHTQLEEAEQE